METGFTRHCLERMSSRNISEQDMAVVLQKGFFRDQPGNEVYTVEYGDTVVVVGYDGSFVTTYRTYPVSRFSKKDCKAEAQKRKFRLKLAALKSIDWFREIKFA